MNNTVLTDVLRFLALGLLLFNGVIITDVVAKVGDAHEHNTVEAAKRIAEEDRAYAKKRWWHEEPAFYATLPEAPPPTQPEPPLPGPPPALTVPADLPAPPPAPSAPAIPTSGCDEPTPEGQTLCWVQTIFRPADQQHAYDVAKWESRFDPAINNEAGSDASGLFQHRKRYWAERETKARAWLAEHHQITLDEPLDIYDGWHSTIVAAWLVYDNGGWRHFHSCKSGQLAFNRWAEQQNTARWDAWLEANRHTGGWVPC